jgi:hypothetical protein
MTTGRKTATVVGSLFKETPKGAGMIELRLATSEGEITARKCVYTKTGDACTKRIEEMVKWSGWDGVNLFWWDTEEPLGKKCEIVVELEPGYIEKDKMFPVVKWINEARTGGGNGNTSRAQQVMAALALEAGVPVPEPPAVAPPKAPPAQSAAGTQQSAWAALQLARPELAQKQLEAAWFEAIAATGKTQPEFTPADWSALAESFANTDDDDGENLPF